MDRKIPLKEVASKFGVSPEYVSHTIALYRISEDIQKIVPRGTNRSLLEILASIDDPANQEVLAKKIAEGCTVREAEAFAKGLETGETIEEKTKAEVALQLIEGGEEKIPADQLTKVKEVTVKKLGKPPVVEWRVEFRDESGILCSRTVTGQCGLDLGARGFHVEHIDLSEPEQPRAQKPLPCTSCSNDKEKGGDCGRVHFHIDDQGNYVCEFQNKHLEEAAGAEKGKEKFSEETEKEERHKELDLDSKAKFCPVCNSQMSPSAYEHLKEKFKAFGELFQ